MIGAVFFLAEKWKGFPDDLYESWNIVVAGGLYLFAASLLLRFHEHDDSGGNQQQQQQHVGFEIRCHRGTPVTLACLAVAACSALALAAGCAVAGTRAGKSVEACVHDVHDGRWCCRRRRDEDDGEGESGEGGRAATTTRGRARYDMVLQIESA